MLEDSLLGCLGIIMLSHLLAPPLAFGQRPAIPGPLNQRCFFFQRQRFPDWAFVLVALRPNYYRRTQ